MGEVIEMKTTVLRDLVKSGKRPVVKLTSYLWDESWGEEGMLAEIVKVGDPDRDGCVSITFDYNRFRDTNLPLQSNGWHLDSAKSEKLGRSTGTAFEADCMDEKDITEDVSFMEDDNVPVELAEVGLLGEFIKSGSKGTYVAWLEAKLEELVPEALKDWKKL